MSLIDRSSVRRELLRGGRMAAVVLCAALLQACGGGSSTTAASDATLPPAQGSSGATGGSTGSGGSGSGGSGGSGAAVTGSATLSWTVPTQREDGSNLTDLAGFKVYYGTSPDNLSQTVTVNGNAVTSYQIDNLSAGTYYFVVTAVDSTGAESPSSGMVSKTI